MKKLFYLIFYIILTLPQITLSQQQRFFIRNPLTSRDVQSLVKNVAAIIRSVAIPLAAVAIIIIGFKIITAVASGRTEEVTRAKTALIWVLVGSAIIVGATVIAEVIVNFAEKL